MTDRNGSTPAIVTTIDGPVGFGNDLAATPTPPTPAERAADGPEARVIEAALRCIARWGLGKTTLDDIAREAGCSRATVYRLFPGGKRALLQRVAEDQVLDLLSEVLAPVDDATTLEELLVDAILAVGRFVDGNGALRTVVRHEPAVLAPFLAFDQLTPLLEGTSALLGPHVRRLVADDDSAGELVEWVTRLLISYSFTPSRSVDLTVEADVRRFVRTYLMAGARPAERPATPTSGKPRARTDHTLEQVAEGA